MSNNRQLAPAAYLVAAVLFVFPLFDSGVSLSPWNTGNAQWRFGAVGLLSNTLMIVALGAFIAVTTAVLTKQDRVRRLLGYTSWILAVVLLAAIAAFALDAVQARPQIRQDMLLSYQLASLTAEVKLLVGALSFALFGKGCRHEGSTR
jgi:hypothetical protein